MPEPFDTIVRWKENLHNHMKYGTSDMFSAIDMEINTQCNRRCNFCPNSKFDRGLKKRFMTSLLFKKIINELRDMKYDGAISPNLYGEALLDNRLPDLLQYIRDNVPKAKIVLFTNGDFLDDKMKKKLHMVDKFYIRWIPKKLSNRGGLVNIPKEREFRQKKCFTTTRRVAIDWEGNVLACCNDYLSAHIIGSLKENTLMEIWNQGVNKNRRERLRGGFPEFDICKHCLK